ncbi:MAG TPA: ABC transporter permease [Candidatus Sulfotelmatobacter sp.]|nr:ABC transporter permease [Candidatus Sulfotelmatobacter sp.]
MIATLLRISRTNLRRDRVAQMMVFVLPIVFFSIFAMVFGRQGFSSTPRISVAVVDEDRSDMSGYLIEAMKADPSLSVVDSARTELAAGTRTGSGGTGSGSQSTGPGASSSLVAIDRARATSMVREGNLPVAVVLPKGWGATFPNFSGQGMKVDVIADVSDPVASHLVVGLIQRCAGVVLKGGPQPVSAAGGPSGGPAATSASNDPGNLVATHVIDLMGDRKRGGRMISFYAAGIAVMFLLFSAAASGGALLDEQDSGTLERVLTTRVGMNGLLIGKWIHITSLGILQIVVMFLWGTVVFHLDLFSHLPGFAIMTVATAAAAAALGLVLATASRSRQQLMGVANVVILSMSALGGSMFPRFLMSATMQKIGLVTFNAWALDGYLKVFWRELPISSLAPQVGVLAGLTIAFLITARWLARRWEAA